jgi:3-oxoacyl-[acyl-carrier protein] reductase
MIESRAKRLGVPFDDALASSESQIPKGHLGEPEDVGRVIAFLASEEAAYLTGNLIRIDGGMYSGLD